MAVDFLPQICYYPASRMKYRLLFHSWNFILFFRGLFYQEVNDDAGDDSTADLPAFHETDSTGVIFQKVFASEVRTLKDALAMLNLRQIEEIISLIGKAENVAIFGGGRFCPGSPHLCH